MAVQGLSLGIPWKLETQFFKILHCIITYIYMPIYKFLLTVPIDPLKFLNAFQRHDAMAVKHCARCNSRAITYPSIIYITNNVRLLRYSPVIIVK